MCARGGAATTSLPGAISILVKYAEAVRRPSNAVRTVSAARSPVAVVNDETRACVSNQARPCFLQIKKATVAVRTPSVRNDIVTMAGGAKGK